MDLFDDEEEAAFRSRLRSWLGVHAPKSPLPADFEAHKTALIAWHQRLYEAGWVGLSWPEVYGGQGLRPAMEAILQEELSRAGAPPPPSIGYIGRAVMSYGSDEQRRRYLPPLLSSREQWCQGFSEPSAGSDLASLRTRAELRGDVFVINGHKIWTSRARFAQHCFLLARPGSTEPKHAGISAIIVDMKTEGITVRPIIEATRNDLHFCEVFFDNVIVPRDKLVGSLGQGWEIARSVLAYERGPIDIGAQAQQFATLKNIVGEARAQGLDSDPETRHACARASVAIEVLRLRSLRSLTMRGKGETPGPSGSIDKLLMSAAQQLLLRTAMDILGPAASIGHREWYNRYLESRAASIYGGTTQIQKSIVARNLLGLSETTAVRKGSAQGRQL
jgi:alkylation response protein AidB-like acyl-CoA dehydrogenase